MRHLDSPRNLQYSMRRAEMSQIYVFASGGISHQKSAGIIRRTPCGSGKRGEKDPALI